MTPVPYRRRLRTVVGALKQERALRAQAKWPRERLAEHQAERLQAVVRHAAEHSPFYRERLAGVDVDRRVALEDLPTLTKPELMERFDDWVTDRRLRHSVVDEHLSAIHDDELLLDEYRVMATGGSTGRRGVFCFSESEWIELTGLMLRGMRTFGITPRIPRLRFATVMAPGPAHMTWRIGATMNVGAHRRLALAATDPLPRLVEALNAFRPDALATFPSVAALLVDEQREGRLRIDPEIVATSSELCTPEVRERIRATWDVEPHEVYGATDGLWGFTCEQRRMHFSEDATIVEVEDDRILVTNLFMRTQPVIRYEITDLVRLDPEPCACGRPFRTVAALEGRSDDVLRFGERAVHPIVLRSPMAKVEGVRQYQIVHRADGLHVLVVPRGGDVREQVRRALEAALADAGAAGVAVRVEQVDAIAREGGAGAKFKLVRSEVAQAPLLAR
jgi:phenylacetate-coenzyme A ligase PaaK-like adenylate-forming protein